MRGMKPPNLFEETYRGFSIHLTYELLINVHHSDIHYSPDLAIKEKINSSKIFAQNFLQIFV
jgi:hypothetical protein